MRIVVEHEPEYSSQWAAIRSIADKIGYSRGMPRSWVRQNRTGSFDGHRGAYGVEPICRMLPIAPSTHQRQKAWTRDPDTRSRHVKGDGRLRAEIK